MDETTKRTRTAIAVQKVENPNWRKGYARTVKLFGEGSSHPSVLLKMVEQCQIVNLAQADTRGAEILGKWSAEVGFNNAKLALAITSPFYITNWEIMQKGSRKLFAMGGGQIPDFGDE